MYTIDIYSFTFIEKFYLECNYLSKDETYLAHWIQDQVLSKGFTINASLFLPGTRLWPGLLPYILPLKPVLRHSAIQNLMIWSDMCYFMWLCNTRPKCYSSSFKTNTINSHVFSQPYCNCPCIIRYGPCQPLYPHQDSAFSCDITFRIPFQYKWLSTIPTLAVFLIS